jgi:hypothetical protein
VNRYLFVVASLDSIIEQMLEDKKKIMNFLNIVNEFTLLNNKIQTSKKQ